METQFTKGIGISVRKLADLQFQSSYQLLEFLRQREITDLQKCKNLYETCYQCTLCLFGDRGLTPYKLKIDMLLRIYKKDEILSPFYYMTEGTEKSHHTASKDYNSKTERWPKRRMGRKFSFLRAVDFCSSKADLLRRYRLSNEDDVKSYPKIRREPILEPVLDIHRTVDNFRCLNFIVLGTYGNIRQTQTSIEKTITANGGTVLNNTDIVNRSKVSFLSHHYCVLPNRRCIDSFTCNLVVIKDTSATKAFYHTTLGNWTYINTEFIFKCSAKSHWWIQNPRDYIFQVDVSAMFSFRKIRYQSVAPQLQRQ